VSVTKKICDTPPLTAADDLARPAGSNAQNSFYFPSFALASSSQ
jgi:hypothetical protein